MRGSLRLLILLAICWFSPAETRSKCPSYELGDGDTMAIAGTYNREELEESMRRFTSLNRTSGSEGNKQAKAIIIESFSDFWQIETDEFKSVEGVTLTNVIASSPASGLDNRITFVIPYDSLGEGVLESALPMQLLINLADLIPKLFVLVRHPVTILFADGEVSLPTRLQGSRRAIEKWRTPSYDFLGTMDSVIALSWLGARFATTAVNDEREICLFDMVRGAEQRLKDLGITAYPGSYFGLRPVQTSEIGSYTLFREAGSITANFGFTPSYPNPADDTLVGLDWLVVSNVYRIVATYTVNHLQSQFSARSFRPPAATRESTNTPLYLLGLLLSSYFLWRIQGHRIRVWLRSKDPAKQRV